MLSNKIAGARKKLQRFYELEFLDGPLVVNDEEQRAWWERDQSGNHINIQQSFEYVFESTKGKDYHAILGFSQGGLLGTALVLTGAFPKVKAVLTAGSPFVEDAFQCGEALAPDTDTIHRGKSIPKLHFAGQTDEMVPVKSTKRLCEEGGNGHLRLHEKGHLFPTKAAYVNEMLEFFEKSLN
jgi:predicted esterase